MRTINLKLSDLSAYRTQLMGVATLMIIACHAPASSVVLPSFISSLCGLGNYGVDIFLLLSGLGMYYSLSKHPIKTVWGVRFYKKRLTRILVPYWLVYIPFCAVMILLGKYGVEDSLLCLSTLEYWVFHRGAWFVSLIILLYLLTPFLFYLINSKGKWFYVTSIIASIVVVCNWMGAMDDSKGEVFTNIISALERVPCFVLGMIFGKECQIGKSISVLWLILLVVICGGFIKGFSVSRGLAWMIVPLMMWGILVVLKCLAKAHAVNKAVVFWGNVSLESYLTNITLNNLLLILIPAYISSSLFYGRWLEYTVVIVLGLVLANLANKASNAIIKRVNN